MPITTETQGLFDHKLSQAELQASLGAHPTVCMLTSAHKALDVRIYEKEARSLVDAGYDVTIVAPHERDEDIGAVKIRGVARPRNRCERMTRTLWSLYRRALAVHADVYHFHDPDLIPVGVLLKLAGKRVVYDVHEDVPREILTKDWIASPLRRAIAAGAEAAHFVSALAFDGIVAATPTIAARFPRRQAVTVQNFPRLRSVSAPAQPYKCRPNKAVYVGLINRLRGGREMVEAISKVPDVVSAQLVLAGRCDPADFAKELRSGEVLKRVDYRGWVPYESVQPLMKEARLGLVVLQPSQIFVECQPLKLFEYMAAALPIVASDFPIWRKIVSESNCGLLVDPLDPEAIARAMIWIFSHPEEAEEMGQRGLAAVQSKYNWANEERVLLDLYDRLSAC